MRLLARSAAVVSTAALITVAHATSVSADPKGFSFPLTCDSTTYTMSVNGNGIFTAAHDNGSSRVFVPSAFGEFEWSVTDSQGNVIDSDTDPAVSKRNAAKTRRTTMTCTYIIEESFEHPQLGTLTFHGEGSVTGFWSRVGR